MSGLAPEEPGVRLADNTTFLHEDMPRLRWSQAAELFEHSIVTLECERPAHLADHPDLPVRLRGALGAMLHAAGDAAMRRPDPFNRLSPYEFLFGEHGYFRPSAPIPKPLAVRGEFAGDGFRVEVLLAGMAQYYAPHVLECMAAALDDGIAFSQDTRHRHSVRILDGRIERRDGCPVAAHGRQCVLNFRTPLAVRSGRAVALTSRAMIHSLLVRAEGLCLWQGFKLDEPATALARRHAAVDVSHREMQAVHWTRHSQRQRGRDIPMTGLVGRMRIEGDLDGLLPAIAICGRFGVGSHAALGLGWFDEAVYP